jgi:hypothetical protein
MAQITFNVGNDTLTGKRIKYTNNEVRIKNGIPIEFNGVISYHEVNDNPAIPDGNTERQKKVVQSIVDFFQTNGLFIDSTTKLYVPEFDGNSVATVGAVSLGSYLENKAANSFPGVAGSDPFWEVIKGLCKEMIDVRKVNGEF